MHDLVYIQSARAPKEVFQGENVASAQMVKKKSSQFPISINENSYHEPMVRTTFIPYVSLLCQEYEDHFIH